MASTDYEQSQSLSNPPLTDEVKQIIRNTIQNNVQDGGTAWRYYSDEELDDLGLSHLKELRNT